MLGVLLADARGDARAPVAAHGAVARVAQAGHERHPRPRDPLHTPARFRRDVTEAVAGQRRDDEVERIRGIGRIGERGDDLQVLDDRAGPPMGHHERHRVLVPRSHVQDMDVHAVDPRAELRHCVEPGLQRSPVVPVRPVGAQLAQVGERHALGRIGLRARPPRARDALAQVAELRVGDVDAERLQLDELITPTGWFSGSRKTPMTSPSMTSIGPTARVPPMLSAFASDASTSGTST